MTVVPELFKLSNKELPVPSVKDDVIDTELLDFQVVVQVPVPACSKVWLKLTVPPAQTAVLSEEIVIAGSGTIVIWWIFDE